MKILNNATFGNWTFGPATGDNDPEDAQNIKTVLAQEPGTRLKYIKAEEDGAFKKLQFGVVAPKSCLAVKFWVSGTTPSDKRELLRLHFHCINNSDGWLDVIGRTECDSKEAVMVSLAPKIPLEEGEKESLLAKARS